MRKNSVIAIFLALICTACSDADYDQTVLIYPDQESAGFKQFAKQCSACHRPPMPNIHPSNLWVTTLNRMRKHRQQRGFSVMTEVRQQEVLEYLQSHSQ